MSLRLEINGRFVGTIQCPAHPRSNGDDPPPDCRWCWRLREVASRALDLAIAINDSKRDGMTVY